MDYNRSKPQEFVQPLLHRIYLASPTMHGDELKYINEAFATNWVSTVGENINSVEQSFCGLLGKPYTVALSSGTAALHMAIRSCAEQIYGRPEAGEGALAGRKVFCSDLTFAATVNPILYEAGEPVLIDSEPSTWNMDPDALERAFSRYPETKLVVVVHLYGTPAQIDRILEICHAHQALLVEDAAEALGATYRGKPLGSYGDIGVISFNGNKIITGSCGGLIVTDDEKAMQRIRKWSTQSREPVSWYQHTELGFNYRMSNLVAGVIRGQLPHLQEHVEKKIQIYNYYRDHLKDLPLTMNPFPKDCSVPNHWLSCAVIHPKAMCKQVRTEDSVSFVHEAGKSCPTEILDRLAALNIEGRPVWKPMHMQPFFKKYAFVNADGDPRTDFGADAFARGFCLPSDIKMQTDEMDVIIDVIHQCFSA